MSALRNGSTSTPLFRPAAIFDAPVRKIRFSSSYGLFRRLARVESITLATSSAQELEPALINKTRIDAFRKFDQHRYVNPFRYDTERDVFEEMEQLRGTSRLTKAYKAALDALDEQLRDVLRIRKENEDGESASRERRMSYIFSFLGFTGITGLILSTDDFLRRHAPWLGKALPHAEGVTLALIYWLVPAALILIIIRLFGPARR